LLVGSGLRCVQAPSFSDAHDGQHMQKNPNPQGKGLVPVLQGLQQHWARVQVAPKQIDQVSLELFTSLFVLQSEFRFNPVPEQDYYLYQVGEGYRLLLVGPDEWSSGYSGRYIGCCTLLSDRTWTLDLDAAVAADEVFMARIEARRQALQERLEAAETLEDALPTFEAELGYYGQALSFILGKSLRVSMQLSGIHALSYEQAKGLLTAPETP
jgi:hypothetical protein